MVKAVDEMLASRDKFAPERYYVYFYEDLTKNSHDWRLFFSPREQPVLVGRESDSGAGKFEHDLPPAPPLRRLREGNGCVQEDPRSLREMIARRRAAHLSDNNELVNCRGLIYKYHRVAVNLGADLLHPDNLVSDSLSV